MASPSLISSGKGGASGSASPTLSAGTITAGSTVLAFASDTSGNTLNSVTGSSGGAYTLVGNIGGGNPGLTCFKKENHPGGSETLTFNFAGAADPGLSFEQWSPSIVDSASLATANTGTSPWSTTSNALASANSTVIFAAACDAGGTVTYSESTGFTKDQEQGDGNLYWTHATFYKAVSSTAAVGSSLTIPSGGLGNQPRRMIFALTATGGGGVTCNLSVTDTSDTVAATAQVAISAALARTDAADTLSATAQALVSASLARTDAADTLVSAAGVVVSATAGTTDTLDTLSATATIGSAPVICDLAVTDAADTLAGTAQTLVGASLADVDVSDTLAAAAAVQVTAGLSSTDQADTLDAFVVTGTLAEVVCALGVTDDPDTLQSFAEIVVERRGGGRRRAANLFYPAYLPEITARLAVVDEDDRLGATAGATWPVLAAGLLVLDDEDALDGSAVVVPWPAVRLVRELELVRG